MGPTLLKSIVALLLVVISQSLPVYAQNKPLTGAWETAIEDIKMTKIYADQFFSVAIYNIKEKQFVSTAGGRWELEGNVISETFEFHTSRPDLVGQVIKTQIDLLKNEKLIVQVNTQKEEWTRIDDGTPGKLMGAWLNTGRMVEGQLQTITPGVRRTMKILSGTRFQWIAYNTETKEFFGTGGGTYTTANGKYTENILFFSRDNSRVGASLQFDFTLEDSNWRHKGLSSKGDPIDEIWTKRQKIGL